MMTTNKSKIDFLKKIENTNLKLPILIDQYANIEKVINLMTRTLKKNNIFICGNGGSASQAEHFSTEFLVRLNKNINRKSLPIIPLSLNNSQITACSNDYSFEKIFSKSLEAIANPRDCLIVLSTSGKSKNILDVINKSKKMKIKSIGFFGKKNKFTKKVDIALYIDSDDTAFIQECHLFLGHFILNEIEKKIFNIK